MFEAQAREYFHGACDHFLMPETEVPETVLKFFLCFFGASLRLTKGF